MGAMHEVLVPDIGDFKDVPIIEVLVKPGDAVKADDSLVTLESDKATMEVPAPLAGVVRDMKVKVGDKVSEGTLILTLEVGEDAPAKSAEPASAPTPAPAQSLPPAAAPAPAAAAPAPPPAPARSEEWPRFAPGPPGDRRRGCWPNQSRPRPHRRRPAR